MAGAARRVVPDEHGHGQRIRLIALSALNDLAIWMLLPLIALQLAQADTSPAIIGFLVGLPWLTLVLGTPLMLRALTALGPLRLLRVSIVAQMLAVAVLLHGPPGATTLSVAALGIAMGPCWMLPDCWLANISPAHTRGRWIGAYEMANGAAIGLGPLLLAVALATDVEPGEIVAVILVAVLLCSMGLVAPRALRLCTARVPTLLAALCREPLLPACAALAGLLEAGAVAMLPVHGAASGLDASAAAMLGAAIGLGNVAVQYPVGLLCDVSGSHRARDVCLACVLLGLVALALPAIDGSMALFIAFLWGGFAGALYTCALTDASGRLDGNRLVVVVTAMMLGYTIGSAVGPWLAGIGLMLQAQFGLFVALALPVLAVIVYASRTGRILAIPGYAGQET